MNVLIASHSPTLTTGYGRVVAHLARAFGEAGWAVRVVGTGHDGSRHGFPFEIVPHRDGPIEGGIAAALGTSTDVLLTVGDPWMFAGVPAMPRPRGTRWAAYFPVDGRPMPLAWAAWARAVDVPVAFSRFTQDVVCDATGLRPPVVYHGVDTTTFAPQDKHEAKRRVGVEGRFVVGTVAANQQRKNLPALFRAFATFAADKPDAVLYLHSPVAGCWDLEELAATCGIEPKTRATLKLDGPRGVADDVLATVYNAFDVFALPTMAEGFGLPILEAQACGVPALATDCSTCPELLPDPFQRLRVRATLTMARNVEQAIVDEDDLSAKLDRLYRDPALRRDLGDRGRAFARTMEWDAVAKELVGVVTRAV